MVKRIGSPVAPAGSPPVILARSSSPPALLASSVPSSSQSSSWSSGRVHPLQPRTCDLPPCLVDRAASCQGRRVGPSWGGSPRGDVGGGVGARGVLLPGRATRVTLLMAQGTAHPSGSAEAPGAPLSRGTEPVAADRPRVRGRGDALAGLVEPSTSVRGPRAGPARGRQTQPSRLGPSRRLLLRSGSAASDSSPSTLRDGLDDSGATQELGPTLKVMVMRKLGDRPLR